jgi:uncharacterized membrane protein
LFVRVLGSGFGPGSRAVWALQGDTTYAVTKVKTNSTTYVSSSELLANITISGDASLSLYDVVAVTATGKKGIGIECFTVTVMGITDLGTLGGTTSKATALNTPIPGNRLLIVGGSKDKAGRDHAAYWYVDMATGVRQSGALPAPSGDAQSGASSVTQAEAIVGGSATTVGGGGRPVLWSPGGWSSSFLNLNGGLYGGTSKMTSPSQIVGQIVTPDGPYAAIWEGSALTRLPGLYGLIEDVNATGVLVGMVKYSSTGAQRAVVWLTRDSALQLPDGGYNSFALGINDAGVIVGMNFTQGASVSRAVRWLPPTVAGGAYTMEDLGITGDAYDINNSGEIVGYDNAGSAFYWFNGQLKKLPPLAANLTAAASAINENGDVVGWGYDHSQSQHAVLWTHVR